MIKNQYLRTLLFPIISFLFWTVFLNTAFGNINTPADSTKLDSLALVALYNATDGPNWTDNTNWLSDKPISAWSGVTVDNGRVSELWIGKNNLSGKLPPEIEQLDYLNRMMIYDNDLKGEFPKVLCRLKRLSSLWMYNTNITGSIPPEVGNLHYLTQFVVHTNELTGTIPDELFNLVDLENLSLSSNQLSGQLSSKFGELKKLKYLSLEDNEFTGPIPPEIGGKTNLQRITLYNNNLTGSIPPEIGNFKRMDILQLQGNQLTGPIPAEFGNLKNLVVLDLSDNKLSGNIPPELGNMSRLYIFKVANNELNGSIPPEFGNCNNLAEFVISNNRLTGNVPTELGNCFRMKDLSLNDNYLSGEIPVEFADFEDLLFLRINNNAFHSLPDLNNIPFLRQLYVWNNRLTFEDIEPNISIRYGFLYSPQQKAGTEKKMRLSMGESITLDCDVGGSTNRYQWFKDKSAINGAESSQYTVHVNDLNDYSNYYVKVTNEIATKLEIQTKDIKIVQTEVNENVIRTEENSFVEFTTSPNALTNTIEFGSTLSVSFRLFNESVSGRTVTLKQMEDLSDYSDIPDAENIMCYYEINTDKLPLKSKITFGYTDEMIEKLGILETDISVNIYNEKLNEWQKVYGIVDTIENTVSVKTRCFSLWCVGESQSSYSVDLLEDPAYVSPDRFYLSPNYPNPFNSSTTIEYHLSEVAHVTIKVYNILGQELETLVNSEKPAGYHSVKWNAANFASGIYFYRITAGTFTGVKKMALIR